MRQITSSPYFIDVYPHKAQYLSGETVKISVEIHNPGEACIEAGVILTIRMLEQNIYREEKKILLSVKETAALEFEFLPAPADWQGFGADAELLLGGDVCHRMSTAFDIVSTWRKAPRYGFLCDFFKENENDSRSMEQMAKYHLNIIQFYDWMYKHDDLVPSEEYFTDPLGRLLSLKAIQNRIGLCHRYGMKAMAYGAIYASSKEFYEEHRDWALYDNNGVVQSLGDWLVIMNISPDSPWTRHIIDQYAKVIQDLDFDGIHMDTYGFPKTAFSVLNGKRQLEKLKDNIPEFIKNTRKELEKYKEGVGLIFNAVNNWPIETAAAADQDAVYIEVWDPNDRYSSLYHIISRARELGGKPVILAAYLSAFGKGSNVENTEAENSFLLASAVIFASGGYHILLGENNGLLREEYFASYASIGDGFVRTVRNYYDFIVKYANLLYDPRLTDLSMTHANGRNGEIVFENGGFSSYGEPDKIWTIIKEMPGYYTINLINLTGIQSDIWNEKKESRPAVVHDIMVKALIDEEIEGVYMASPDLENGILKELRFEYIENGRGKSIAVTVPTLEVWDLIYIKVK